MKKTFKDMSGGDNEIDLQEHDISKYNVLFHVTLKDRRKAIETQGLLKLQPQHKAIIRHDALFLSYPINMDTTDCFRWNDQYYALIVLDAKLLNIDGYMFYDDPFGQQDQSSKRNHLCCLNDIPSKYIKQIIEY